MSVTMDWTRRVADHLDKDELKTVVKDAIKEWMSESWTSGARWTLFSLLRAAAIALFGAVTWLVLTANGWHRGQ